MSKEMMTKAALHKRLATKPSEERISLILDVLTATPSRLHDLRASLADDDLDRPLGQGERSFKRDLTHLIYCAERGSDPIFQALILNEPFIARIHAERDWGALMRYETFKVAELMAYFTFRRRALLHILSDLSRDQWDRSTRREGVKRTESVYYTARGLCVHEYGHLEDLAKKLDAVIR
ncbi:MAG: DinB family protein [Chloroflexota bacterium]|nr:DinB family protein [Chloroflexota bacterium]